MRATIDDGSTLVVSVDSAAHARHLWTHYADELGPGAPS
jgi:hypothetical protein